MKTIFDGVVVLMEDVRTPREELLGPKIRFCVFLETKSDFMGICHTVSHFGGFRSTLSHFGVFFKFCQQIKKRK